MSTPTDPRVARLMAMVDVCVNSASMEELKERTDRLRTALYEALGDSQTTWLEANQPDVFRRGIWDALAAHPSTDQNHAG